MTKSLTFIDSFGNYNLYTLCVPDELKKWRFSALIEFLRTDPNLHEEKGFVVSVPDLLAHQRLRRITCYPESSLSLSPTFWQNNRELHDDEFVNLSQKENFIEIKRKSSDKNTFKIPDCKQKNIEDYHVCKTIICNAIDKALDLKSIFTDIDSFEQLTDCFSQISYEDRLKLVFHVALTIYVAPFENISRLTGCSCFRSGAEMWLSIADGFGGICSEKTSALKFICDILGIKNRPVFGSSYNIPEDIENQYISFIKARGDLPPPVWLQHHLLEIFLDEKSFLIDVANGNLPFLFLNKDDADSRLAGGMRMRLVYHTERLNLKRCAESLGDIMLTFSEYHIPDIAWQFIFKQQLGLEISNNHYLGVFADYHSQRSSIMQQYYSNAAKEAGLLYPLFLHKNNLCTLKDKNMIIFLEEIRNNLFDFYPFREYTGDFTFVLQPLSSDRWIRPQISSQIYKICNINDIIKKTTKQLCK